MDIYINNAYQLRACQKSVNWERWEKKVCKNPNLLDIIGLLPDVIQIFRQGHAKICFNNQAFQGCLL